MSIVQYLRFMCVGGFVGLVTIAARQVAGLVLGDSSVLRYSISVALAYLLGIALSYLLNRRFTFGQDSSAHSVRTMTAFVTVAGIGLVTTWLLSLGIRYGTPVERVAGRYAATAAFAVATVLASLLSYPLNARWVFGARRG